MGIKLKSLEEVLNEAPLDENEEFAFDKDINVNEKMNLEQVRSQVSSNINRAMKMLLSNQSVTMSTKGMKLLDNTVKLLKTL